MIHIRTLIFVRSIAGYNDESPPVTFINELMSRELAVKDHNSHRWASHIKQLLHDNDRPSAADILARPLKKVRWKKMVKEAVFKKWTENLWEAAEEMSTMQFLTPRPTASDSCTQLGRAYTMHCPYLKQQLGPSCL